MAGESNVSKPSVRPSGVLGIAHREARLRRELRWPQQGRIVPHVARSCGGGLIPAVEELPGLGSVARLQAEGSVGSVAVPHQPCAARRRARRGMA